MADQDWVAIFRTYTPTELAAEIVSLKTEKSVYASQSSGSKSYVKDLREVKAQLAAAVQVQNERATTGNAMVGIVDFSGRGGCR